MSSGGWGQRGGDGATPALLRRWGLLPSTAVLQREKASGLSVEEEDEVPTSICSHGEDRGGASSAEPLQTRCPQPRRRVFVYLRFGDFLAR